MKTMKTLCQTRNKFIDWFTDLDRCKYYAVVVEL